MHRKLYFSGGLDQAAGSFNMLKGTVGVGGRLWEVEVAWWDSIFKISGPCHAVPEPLAIYDFLAHWNIYFGPKRGEVLPQPFSPPPPLAATPLVFGSVNQSACCWRLKDAKASSMKKCYEIGLDALQGFHSWHYVIQLRLMLKTGCNLCHWSRN